MDEHNLHLLTVNTLKRNLTNGQVNDVSQLYANQYLLLTEGQSTISHWMVYRMFSYLFSILDQWIQANQISTHRPPKDAEILPFHLVIVYTGTDKASINDFTRSLSRYGDTFRKMIHLATEENAKGIAWEYIEACHRWDYWKKLYPDDPETAIEITLDDCI